MIDSNQIEQIKDQLINQIDKIFPEDKQEAAKRKILSMDASELEQFLQQNNLMQQNQQNPFRMIVSKQVPSYKIDENKNCLAVLELNPISEGHTLIIPKTPIKEGKKIPAYLTNFASKVAKKIKANLKSKDISVVPTPMFDETIINVLPIYKNETLNSERKQASPENLQQIQNKLLKKAIKKTVKKSKPEKVENIRLPKRIP